MDGERCEDSTSDQSHLVDFHSGDRVRRSALIRKRQKMLLVPLSLRQKSYSDRQTPPAVLPFRDTYIMQSRMID